MICNEQLGFWVIFLYDEEKKNNSSGLVQAYDILIPKNYLTGLSKFYVFSKYSRNVFSSIHRRIHSNTIIKPEAKQRIYGIEEK